MELGEVRVARDEDFKKVWCLMEDQDGWRLDHNSTRKKISTAVWTKDNNTNFKIIKLQATLSDIKSETLFDVLMDTEYRKKWDSYMLESQDVGYLDATNDIGYYAVRCPAPFKNRDFVLQRSWQVKNGEYCLMNHSIFYEPIPPKRGIIRGTSYLTGYTITSNNSSSCTVGYITHSDPRGSLPSWLVNKMTTVFAPKMVKRIHKACLKYNAWKDKHSPFFKPWIRAEQVCLARIDISKCLQTEIPQPETETWEEINLEDEPTNLIEFLEDECENN